MNKEDIMARSKKKEVAEVIEPITEEIKADEAIDILEAEIAKEEVPAVEAEEPKPAKKKVTIKQGIVQGCGLLNVREQASTQAKAVKQISGNTRIEILGEDGNFYKIDGGYVMKDFVKIV